jgi:hypothetical protein
MPVSMANVDDGVMTGWKQVVAWVSTVAAGVALVGLGVFFVVTGLDAADKWASVIGVFATLIGLGLSVYGVVLTRRPPSPLVPGPQRVERVDAGQGIDVVDTVAGNVRLGISPIAASPITPGPPTSSSPRPLGEQSVTDVRATGDIRIVRGVGGDVDIAP